jgi:hypothetical protein
MLAEIPCVTRAIESIKSGAFDYLTPPFSLENLEKVWENIEESTSLKKELPFNSGKIEQIMAQSPVMKQIFDQVTEPNVKICWNCNAEDLLPPGLEANFHSVKKWFGDTVHVREFNVGDYPYPQLFKLFSEMNYEGWILLEARTQPADRVVALQEQLGLFNGLVAQSKR